jgi:hypothetical protein
VRRGDDNKYQLVLMYGRTSVKWSPSLTSLGKLNRSSYLIRC